MQTFIDSSHAVHEDMKCHIGGTITFGTGVLSVKSVKQNMNSRSSNETEVIGNSEYLPFNIWFQYFMESQGYTLHSNLLWQDNWGAQKMAENGKMSCLSKSRHIAIKFFWITDRVKQGLLHVHHCPTDIMLADFFTQPLQGKKFIMFRRVIMGWDHASTLWQYALKNNGPGEIVPSKERVEENAKTVIVEEPLNGSKNVENGSKKVDGTTRNTDHTATVRWSDIVKIGGPGSIEDQMSSKEKGKSS